MNFAAGLDRLLDLGGFTEPWVSHSPDAALRRSREYRMRLVEEEIRDLEGVSDVSAIELLSDAGVKVVIDADRLPCSGPSPGVSTHRRYKSRKCWA